MAGEIHYEIMDSLVVFPLRTFISDRNCVVDFCLYYLSIHALLHVAGIVTSVR